MLATTILGVTINAIWAFVLFVFWVMIAFWPASVAGRKGHSFFWFFILSLFFFPLSIILAYLVDDRTSVQPAHQ